MSASDLFASNLFNCDSSHSCYRIVLSTSDVFSREDFCLQAHFILAIFMVHVCESTIVHSSSITEHPGKMNTTYKITWLQYVSIFIFSCDRKIIMHSTFRIFQNVLFAAGYSGCF